MKVRHLRSTNVLEELSEGLRGAFGGLVPKPR
jgi:hypothetical protein